MKNLNEYVKDGLFDNIDKLEGKNGLAAQDKQLKKDITEWICSHYYSQPSEAKSHLVKKRNLEVDMSTTPPTVSYVPKNISDNKLCASSNLTSLNNDGMFQWSNVEGSFICFYSKIKTLEGAPKEVGEDFDCSYCMYIESLKGAPEKVKNFKCEKCRNLTSLEGSPKEVRGDFECAYCISLTSLKGAPKEVGSDFVCYGCEKEFSKEDVKKVCNVKKYIYV